MLKRYRSESLSYETLFDVSGKQQRITEIEGLMAASGFWDNQERAQKSVSELKGLKSIVGPLIEVIQASGDLGGLLEMGEEDESLEPEIKSEIKRLEQQSENLELKALLDGPLDSAGAILTINARDGGTDANDWAEMLLRMYLQWAQQHEYKVELMDRSDNEEAGINSATILVQGPMAFGYLKGETGTHRLVRISPFNSEGKRQTSFAAISVSPEVDEDFDIEIDWDKDVREDKYRASGAGGQHVNKTDSAIRLTHLPTGEVVQCQNERSQHKNRAAARKMLLATLARREEDKRAEEQAEKYKSQAKVGFGSQIRNYFLHPDQRVKDTRTGHYQGNFHAVLDGNIQDFLESYLRWRVKDASDN